MGELLLIRHGETEWSAVRRHTSRTDLELTDRGRRQAGRLRELLAGRDFAAVLSSPRQRALSTANAAGLTVTDIEADLAEWDYGDYEGRTTVEIHRDRPGWNLWTDGCPHGETPQQVSTRIDRVLARVAPLLQRRDVALVGHAHSLRVAGARWIGMPACDGGRLRLDTASISVLGYEHRRQVILTWNQQARPAHT